MSFQIQALGLAIGGLFTIGASQAQTFRCAVGGTTYISDRPCAPTNPSPARLMGAGATQPQMATAYRQPTPTVQPAPEHQRYLSQRCAEISDAIRTAPNRGVGYPVIRDLQNEYHNNCSEDDAEARKRASQDRARQREGARAVRQEAERARLENQRLQERCIALRDAIRARRARGETGSSAETAYNENCLGR